MLGYVRPCLVLLLLAACAGAPPGPMPRRLVDVPTGETEADKAVVRARQSWERGDAATALAAATAVLADAPRHVDGLRLRQDVLRARGRVGLLRAEVEAMLAADPDDAVAHYLMGRIVPGDEAKQAAFTRAAELAPDSLWPWLGLAFALRHRDPDASLQIYRGLGAAAAGHPVVAVPLASALRQAGDYAGAMEVYQRLRGRPEVPGVGDLGIAQTLLLMEKRRESWAPMLAALRARPFDPGVRQLVRDWLIAGLPDEQIDQVLDVLAEAPGRVGEFAGGDGLMVMVTMLLRMQRPHAALDLLQRSGVSMATPALRRLQRRTMLATGDVGGFLAAVAADLPGALLQDEQNQVRGLWLALLRGPWREGDPLATAPQAEALVRALRDCGLLAEAAEVGALASRRWPQQRPALDELRAELQRELSFEGALRRILYQRYATREPAELETVLAELRTVSQTVFGRDVVGRPARFQAPLVGEMLDPFGAGLAEHLRRYNKYLALGRRAGGVIEGLLLTRMSVRELPPDADLPLPGRCFEVLGENREIRSLSGVMGGDLAGVALLHHYVIDFDAVREWAQGIAERRRIAREDGGALLADPLPRQVAPMEPLDAAWRLAAMSPVQDSRLDLAVLDMIRCHERAHLVDSFHYLPFESNLFRVLGLLVGHMFSPDAIEAEMERRAELAAVALSPWPELALAHVADFLEPGGDSPHARGFRRLAEDVAAELAAGGVPEADCRPHRWHRVPAATLAAAARAVMNRGR